MIAFYSEFRPGLLYVLINVSTEETFGSKTNQLFCQLFSPMIHENQGRGQISVVLRCKFGRRHKLAIKINHLGITTKINSPNQNLVVVIGTAQHGFQIVLFEANAIRAIVAGKFQHQYKIVILHLPGYGLEICNRYQVFISGIAGTNKK